jgi:putative glycerol-1-phosphate prenyltransferase
VKNKIYKLLKETKNSIAILIDPEKVINQIDFEGFADRINSSKIDFVLIGGSTAERSQIELVVEKLKNKCSIPIILFPGSPEQLSNKADAILFLSLISGRNPYYLIESQIEAALHVSEMNIECIPTSYILIDGKSESSVAKVSKTEPIPVEQSPLIYKTALAGKLLGQTATYLEAGSGAKRSIPIDIVKKISTLDTILIVGGGVNSITQIQEFHKTGAALVVIGNYIEKNPEFLEDIKNYKNQLIKQSL